MIETRDLHYYVKDRTIINGLDVRFESGQFVSIIGANGAGKSTFLRLIAGELAPRAGEIMISGQPVKCYSMKEMAGFRAYLHQSNVMEIPFLVEEVVAMGRYHKEAGEEQDQAIIDECLRVCRLCHLRDRIVRQLSGGEQQRVHLARVLAQLWDCERGILLLDEPISNMDIQYQHQTLAIAKAFSKVGFLVVAVLHDLDLVAQYSDQVLMMKAGKRAWYGPPQEVLKRETILSVFGIESSVRLDPQHQTTHVHAAPVNLSVLEFNSRYQGRQPNRV